MKDLNVDKTLGRAMAGALDKILDRSMDRTKVSAMDRALDRDKDRAMDSAMAGHWIRLWEMQDARGGGKRVA